MADFPCEGPEETAYAEEIGTWKSTQILTYI